MRPPRLILFWIVLIAALLFIEFAELTRLFTLPFLQAISNVVAFAFALIFVTIVALVGAIFIGIYVSQRLLSSRGFSPFEEEMLKMRAEVMEMRRQMHDLLGRSGDPSSSGRPGDPDASERRP
ncbi:MAG: hypothetical protein L3K14_05750 [Thermoplasmata archaeon]|nr:hypothetical protein [Thermoplasmata archaeon]